MSFDFEQTMQQFGAMDTHGRVDAVEQLMVENFAPLDCPVAHTFTPGLYSRRILMAAGSMVTSKIHKTRHQYVILRGTVSVWTEHEGVMTYEAPYVGITEPGTRRVLFNHTETEWVTFHPTEKETVEDVEEEIIEKHENLLLPKISLDLTKGVHNL